MYVGKYKIDENEIAKLFNENKSHRDIAKILNVPKATVTYLLNKNGFIRGKFDRFKNCQLCGKVHGGIYSKYCNTCVSRIRRFKTKRKAVLYKGGKCSKCKWSGLENEISAFEFHHPDGRNKEMTLSKNMNKKWELIQKELDKCVLLCSNCHRIEHSKYDDEKLIQEANKYNGNYYRDTKEIKTGEFIQKTIDEENNCECCGNKIFGNLKFCSQKCAKIANRKVVRPSWDQLKTDIIQMSIVQVGKKYGVSDNAIRKWVKNYEGSNPSTDSNLDNGKIA